MEYNQDQGCATMTLPLRYAPLWDIWKCMRDGMAIACGVSIRIMSCYVSSVSVICMLGDLISEDRRAIKMTQDVVYIAETGYRVWYLYYLMCVRSNSLIESEWRIYATLVQIMASRWPLGNVAVILIVWILNTLYRVLAWALAITLLSCVKSHY